MAHNLEFKVPNKATLEYLSELVSRENAVVERVEWKSNYNSYVVYDYEPFCSDGFTISATVTSSDKNTLRFIKYLYDKKQSELELLKNCYELSAKSKSKKSKETQIS